jgi:hypothetical protein
MTDLGTIFLLIPSALFSLAMVALLLWPMFVAALEIFKAIRRGARQPTQFVITKQGETIWIRESGAVTSESVPVGDKRLRLGVLFACAIEAAFVVFLAVFLFQHSDPRGDGMEMVGVGFAFMLIFLPLTFPAFILARYGHRLVLAAVLSALAAVAYFVFWLETLSELGVPKSYS